MNIMTSGKGYRWKCLKCGYVLPNESDLLKVCPDCGVVGEFVKEAEREYIRPLKAVR